MKLAGIIKKENHVSSEDRGDNILNVLKEWMEVSATCKVYLLCINNSYFDLCLVTEK